MTDHFALRSRSCASKNPRIRSWLIDVTSIPCGLASPGGSKFWAPPPSHPQPISRTGLELAFLTEDRRSGYLEASGKRRGAASECRWTQILPGPEGDLKFCSLSSNVAPKFEVRFILRAFSVGRFACAISMRLTAIRSRFPDELDQTDSPSLTWSPSRTLISATRPGLGRANDMLHLHGLEHAAAAAPASTLSCCFTCTSMTRPGIGARMLPLDRGARIASATGFLSLNRRVMPSTKSVSSPSDR